MQDFSLHILDLVENSINAKAKRVEIKIEENEKDIIELLRTVIKIPSLTGEEGAAQEFVARYLRDLGIIITIAILLALVHEICRETETIIPINTDLNSRLRRFRKNHRVKKS